MHKELDFEEANNPCEHYYGQARTEMTAFLPKQLGNVLEIGCGSGTFRAYINTTPLGQTVKSYWGVEPCKSAVSNAQRKQDRIFLGTFDEVKDLIPDYFLTL